MLAGSRLLIAHSEPNLASRRLSSIAGDVSRQLSGQISRRRRHGAPLLVQNHTEERAVHFEMAVVVDEP